MVRINSDSDMSTKSDKSDEEVEHHIVTTEMRPSVSFSNIEGVRQKPKLTIDTNIKKSTVQALSTDASPLLLQPFLILRCMHAKKDVKFVITAEETSDGTLTIMFVLRDGETKEFKSKVSKMKPEIVARLTS